MNTSRRQCLLSIGAFLASPAVAPLVLHAAEAKPDITLELVVPAKWKLPEAGKESMLAVELRVTNQTADELNFSVQDTLEPIVKTAAGARVKLGYARDATRLAPPLKIAGGKTEIVPLPTRLYWDNNAPAFGINDPTAGVWTAALMKGKYAIGLHVKNTAKASRSGKPLWIGEADAKGIGFEVS